MSAILSELVVSCVSLHPFSPVRIFSVQLFILSLSERQSFALLLFKLSIVSLPRVALLPLHVWHEALPPSYQPRAAFATSLSFSTQWQQLLQQLSPSLLLLFALLLTRADAVSMLTPTPVAHPSALLSADVLCFSI